MSNLNDLSESYLDDLISGYNGVTGTDALPRLISEVRRHRAAQRVTADHVCEVVRAVIISNTDLADLTDFQINAITTRIAAQLSGNKPEQPTCDDRQTAAASTKRVHKTVRDAVIAEMWRMVSFDFGDAGVQADFHEALATRVAEQLTGSGIKPPLIPGYEACRECRYWLGLVTEPCAEHHGMMKLSAAERTLLYQMRAGTHAPSGHPSNDSAERVREVVRAAVDAELTTRRFKAALGIEAEPITAAIAARAAEQLTGTAVATRAAEQLPRAAAPANKDHVYHLVMNEATRLLADEPVDGCGIAKRLAAFCTEQLAASCAAPPAGAASCAAPPAGGASCAEPPAGAASCAEPPAGAASCAEPPAGGASCAEPPAGVASCAAPPAGAASCAAPPAGAASCAEPPAGAAGCLSMADREALDWLRKHCRTNWAVPEARRAAAALDRLLAAPPPLGRR